MCFSIGMYSCPMHPIQLVGLYTTRRPVFRWKTMGYDWILVDSIGQPSQFYRQKVFKCYLSKHNGKFSIYTVYVYLKKGNCLYKDCFTICNQITCFKDQWFSLYWIGYKNRDYYFRFSQRPYRDYKE